MLGEGDASLKRPSNRCERPPRPGGAHMRGGRFHDRSRSALVARWGALGATAASTPLAKGGEAVEKELARLEGMQGSAMKADKKAWLAKRVHILKGLAA